MRAQNQLGQTVPVSEASGRSRHYVFADLLNVLACFSVVTIHVFLNVFEPERTGTWVRSAFMHEANGYAVPVFFMLSGMNLLWYRERYSTAVFFKKRLWRVGRALLLASALCYVLFCAFPNEFLGRQEFAGVFGLGDFLQRFLTGSINVTYWFLYTIIYLYLLTPLLSLAAGNRRLLRYLLALTFFGAFVIPMAEHLGVGAQYFGTLTNWPLFGTFGLLYYLLGAYLAYYGRTDRVPIWVWAILFCGSVLAGTVLALWDTGWFSPQGLEHTFDDYWTSYSSPLCIVTAVSVFAAGKRLEPWLRRRPDRFRRVLRTMSAGSLGVYLLHFAVTQWCIAHEGRVTVLGWLRSNPVFNIVAIYVFCLAMSLAWRFLVERVKRLMDGVIRPR